MGKQLQAESELILDAFSPAPPKMCFLQPSLKAGVLRSSESQGCLLDLLGKNAHVSISTVPRL